MPRAQCPRKLPRESHERLKLRSPPKYTARLECPGHADRHRGGIAVIRTNAFVFRAEGEILPFCLDTRAVSELVVRLIYVRADRNTGILADARSVWIHIAGLVRLQPRNAHLAEDIEIRQR